MWTIVKNQRMTKSSRWILVDRLKGNKYEVLRGKKVLHNLIPKHKSLDTPESYCTESLKYSEPDNNRHKLGNLIDPGCNWEAKGVCVKCQWHREKTKRLDHLMTTSEKSPVSRQSATSAVRWSCKSLEWTRSRIGSSSIVEHWTLKLKTWKWLRRLKRPQDIANKQFWACHSIMSYNEFKYPTTFKILIRSGIFEIGQDYRCTSLYI